MTDYENGVTIGRCPHGSTIDTAAMEKRHHGDHDTLIVFVPPGTAKDAQRRIWAALNSAPHQSDAEFELMQAAAHENNMARMFGSL